MCIVVGVHVPRDYFVSGDDDGGDDADDGGGDDGGDGDDNHDDGDDGGDGGDDGGDGAEGGDDGGDGGDDFVGVFADSRLCEGTCACALGSSRVRVWLQSLLVWLIGQKRHWQYSPSSWN